MKTGGVLIHINPDYLGTMIQMTQVLSYPEFPDEYRNPMFRPLYIANIYIYIYTDIYLYIH